MTGAVDADERPSEARVEALLAEANEVLGRIRGVNDVLDGLDDGSLVVIDD